MGYKDHAIRELRAIGYDIKENEDKAFKKLKDDEIDINDVVVESLLELLEVFSKQGHSGYSAPYVLDLFTKLASHKPLGPLTGENWEWEDVSHFGDETMAFQNIRDSRFFKDKNGRVYWTEGKIFVEPDGSSYVGRDSIMYIDKFPYDPETVYIYVDADGNPINKDVDKVS